MGPVRNPRCGAERIALWAGPFKSNAQGAPYLCVRDLLVVVKAVKQGCLAGLEQVVARGNQPSPFGLPSLEQRFEFKQVHAGFGGVTADVALGRLAVQGKV